MRFGAEQIEGPIELPGNSSTTTYLVRVSHVREMKLFVHVYRYVCKRFRVPLDLVPREVRDQNER